MVDSRCTKTQQVAREYGTGSATVEDVIAALKQGTGKRIGYDTEGDDLKSMYIRMINDDLGSLYLDGWDGVVDVYHDGGLTFEQFSVLHDAYVGPRRNSTSEAVGEPGRECVRGGWLPHRVALERSSPGSLKLSSGPRPGSYRDPAHPVRDVPVLRRRRLRDARRRRHKDGLDRLDC
jgi:hypothetical protein